MILENIRKAIKKSGLSRYRIARNTKIDQSVPFRIINNGSCSIQTADVLCEYLDLELRPKQRKGR